MNVIKFELLKLRSKSRGWLGPILVFILILVAFPLTLEVSNKDLGQSFFSVLWIAMLLVMMLATEDIFLEDYNDGSLEQFAISNINLPPFFISSDDFFIIFLISDIPSNPPSRANFGSKLIISFSKYFKSNFLI